MIGALRGSVLLALGATTFLLCAAGIRALLPWPAEGSLDARWRHFRAHRDDYDLVFVGSSTVARGVDPGAFDRALAQHGRALHSYNLAADNMQSTEAGYLLRQVVAHRTPRLRYAVIELLEFAPRGMLRRNAFTDRAVYWHDLPGLLDAWRRVAASRDGRREKLELVWLHLRHAAWRASNFGRAERAIEAWHDGADPADLAVAAAGGFEALDDRPDPASLRMREQFLASLPGYVAQLDEIELRNRVPSLAPADLARSMREQTAWLRAAGIEPIYVIPPVSWPTPELIAIAREPGIGAVVSLASPARFPELFDPAHRWDGTHVNRAGAALASERLAAEVGPRLEGAGRP